MKHILITLILLSTITSYGQTYRNYGAQNSSEISRTPGASFWPFYAGHGDTSILMVDNEGNIQYTSKSGIIVDIDTTRFVLKADSVNGYVTPYDFTIGLADKINTSAISQSYSDNATTTVPSSKALNDGLATKIDSALYAFVFPIQYGAIANGVTDDRNAIQSALNTGKNVDLQGKSYFIGDSLVFSRDYQKIQNGTILISGKRGMVINSGRYYCKVENITFIGSGKDAAVTREYGVYLRNTWGNDIISCNGLNIGNSAFFVDSCIADLTLHRDRIGNNFTNCYVESCNTGFNFSYKSQYNDIIGGKGMLCDSAAIIRGGNNRIYGNFAQNTVGVYMSTENANDGHATSNGLSSNHNTYNLIVHNLTRAYTFNGCSFQDGLIHIVNSPNISIINSFLGTGGITNDGSTAFTMTGNTFASAIGTTTLNSGTNYFFCNKLNYASPSQVAKDLYARCVELQSDTALTNLLRFGPATSIPIVNKFAQSQVVNKPAAFYQTNGSAQLGAVTFKHAWGTTGGHYSARLHGVGFNPAFAFTADVSFVQTSSTAFGSSTGTQGLSATMTNFTGTLPFDSLKLAIVSDSMLIMIGNEASSWAASSRIWLDEITPANFNGTFASDATFRNGWTSSITPDFTGISNPIVTTPFVKTINTATYSEVQSTATLATTNATQTIIQTIPLATGQTITIEADVTGVSGANRIAGLKRVVYTNVGGVMTILGSIQDGYATQTDAALSTASFNFGTSGTSVTVRVIGVAATNINWTSLIKYKIR